MPVVALLGSGPVNVTSSTGQQFGIPLSLLAVKNGAIDTSRLSSSVATAAGPALKALFLSGALQPGTAPAPVLAMTIKAKLPGTAGNKVSLTFAQVNPNATSPADSTVDVTLDYEDRREGLTVASIGTELGAPTGGTHPSVVALAGPAAKLPGILPATKLSGSPLGLKVPAEDGSGDAFVLTTSGSNPLLADISIAVEAVDKTAGTFTLVIALEHAETGLKLSQLGTKFGLLVDVTPGPGGYAPPAPGTITLSGGAEAATTPSKTAEASVLSD